jgi:hypothetical protein
MMKIDLKPKPGVLAQFAVVALVGLPLIAMLVLRLCGVWSWTHPAFLVAIGVGLVQLVAHAIGVKQLTLALYVVLTVLAFPIGFVLSHVLMASIYYLVITPIGLVFRLVGRDAMGKKLDPAAKTYWHDRGPARPAASYFKLY